MRTAALGPADHVITVLQCTFICNDSDDDDDDDDDDMVEVVVMALMMFKASIHPIQFHL